MLTLLAILHIFIAVALIMFVLLQDPKGGAMGVFSGGSSSSSFFGSTGASNFLTTTTRWLAVAFAASCLTLTYITAKKGGSVMDGFVPPPTPQSATPAAAPGTDGAPAAPSTDAPESTTPPSSDKK